MKTRKRIILDSTISFLGLRDELGKALNVYPDRLNAQYRLSSEKESAYPLGLNEISDFQGLITSLRPLSVPTKTKTGRSSTRKPPPIVNVFHSVSSAPNAESIPTKAGRVRKI
jgi:hypothetical protein